MIHAHCFVCCAYKLEYFKDIGATEVLLTYTHIFSEKIAKIRAERR